MYNVKVPALHNLAGKKSARWRIWQIVGLLKSLYVIIFEMSVSKLYSLLLTLEGQEYGYTL